MAAKAERFELRLSDEKKTRWNAGAKDRGYATLAEFIDGCVEAELATDAPPARKKPAAKKATSKRGGDFQRGRPRTEMCEHRRRADEYCSRCDP